MKPDDKANPNKKPVPVAWIKTYTGERARPRASSRPRWATPATSKTRASAACWSTPATGAWAGRQDPGQGRRAIIGEYNPNDIGFGGYKKGVKPADHRAAGLMMGGTKKVNLYAEVKDGLDEMVAIEKGEREPSRVHRFFTSKDIKALRKKGGCLASTFAAMLGVSNRTLQDWAAVPAHPDRPRHEPLAAVRSHARSDHKSPGLN